MTQVTTGPVSGSSPVRGRARVAWGVVLAILLTIPCGYLLSYAAFLVALLGLFYAILFGLIFGAAMYRVWAPLRPLAPRTIRLGVALVVLAAWGGSLVWEGLTFPSDVAKEAIEQVEAIKLPDQTAADVYAAAAQAAREFLAQRYPPGGVIGYWRWAMAEKSIEIPITGVEHPRPIIYNSNGWMFLARVVLCGVALALAVHSQVAPLAKPLRDE